MTRFLVFALLSAAIGASPNQQTFNGVITDSMCDSADHSLMRMGPTDAECTVACIDAHGATYVLRAGQTVYALTDQKTPEKFAGQKVRVSGTLDAATRTIKVESIQPDK